MPQWKTFLDIAQTISPALGLVLLWFWFELRQLKAKVNNQDQIVQLLSKMDKRLVVLETILEEMRRNK